MTFPTLSTWIGSQREDSACEDHDWLRDPNSGEALTPNRSSSPEQVDRAVDAATRAHTEGYWIGLGPEGRAPILRAFADELDARADEIARLDALSSGVPISTTRLFAGSNGGTVRSVTERALALGDVVALPADGRDVRLFRAPWGPTALLLPWNAPAAMAVKKVSFALAAGASCVMKPSPASPWSAQLVAEAAQAAGIPDGVVSLVLGGQEVGEQLVGDSRIAAIAMTGSTPAGRAIAAKAAPRFARLRLELGSNNPAVVLGDADVLRAARAIASGSMKMSGQWCEAPRRVLVDRALLDELVAALRVELAALRIGSSLDDKTDLGPVAFEARRNELLAQCQTLRDAGAQIYEAQSVPDKGWFVAPTIAVAEQIELDNELFGPIVTVQPFDDADQAVSIANTGQVGLAAYVFGRDESRALDVGRRILAGEVKINGTSVLDMSAESAQSFFGDSGLGGHGDADVLDFYTGKRVIGTDAPGLPL
ncbi:aldehyde dehydrogenase family protein [Rhodococcus qingshengii]|uniref:aldehyde dehydrogenase family protein n=1 Tax=Rhodococcus qingshengii TaxID=334542 RepID=UPI0036D84E3A